MLERVAILGIVVLASSFTVRAWAKKPVVAVFDIEPRGVHLRRMAFQNLSDYLSDKLAATGALRIVPRDQLKRRLSRQKVKSYRACYGQTCQIEIGKELAAQKSLATKVLKIGGRCVVTSTLYDLRKAATERGATAKGSCQEKGIMASIDRVVVRLTSGAAGSSAAAGAGKPVAARYCAGLRIPPNAAEIRRNHGLVTVYGYHKQGFAEVAEQAERLIEADRWKVVKRDDQSRGRSGRLILHIKRKQTSCAVRIVGIKGRGKCGLIVTRLPEVSRRRAREP